MKGRSRAVTSPDGTSISLLTDGVGPPLLLVHGGMSTRVDLLPLWERLIGERQVTAMDRRGRGSSPDVAAGYSLQRECEDIAAVAELLASESGGPIDVFGHSYGAVCTFGAAAAGAPFRRLVIYEPPGPATVRPSLAADMEALIANGETGRAMMQFLSEIIDLSDADIQALRDSPGSDEVLPIMARTFGRESRGLTAADLPALAVDVHQPVLMLLGERSPAWAASMTGQVAEALAVAEVRTLAGQGHLGPQLAPELVADAMRSFLISA
jgi:pimeloyl-ACP methyl ester carboxylesterase